MDQQRCCQSPACPRFTDSVSKLERPRSSFELGDVQFLIPPSIPFFQIHVLPAAQSGPEEHQHHRQSRHPVWGEAAHQPRSVPPPPGVAEPPCHVSRGFLSRGDSIHPHPGCLQHLWTAQGSRAGGRGEQEIAGGIDSIKGSAFQLIFWSGSCHLLVPLHATICH